MARDGIFTEEQIKDYGELFKQVTGTDVTQAGVAKRVLDMNIAGQGGAALAPADQDIIIDPDTTADVVYFGWAVMGTSTASALWKIKRESISGCISTFTYADSNASYDNIWDDRASLTYV